jgi:tungstate transport system substrate-binding protein
MIELKVFLCREQRLSATIRLLPKMQAWLVLVLVCGVACGRLAPSLDIATTTSVVNSGLLEAILPQFGDYRVRVHAAGSGRSLVMLEEGTAELVISHAPAAEQQTLERHPDWRYQKLAFNRFVIVGPLNDPASVATAPNAVEAFKRMATTGESFVSRGDSSGTHERETMFWKLAGITASSDHLLTSGASMAVTLRQSASQHAYTLSDQATWWQLERELPELRQLLSDDPALLNTYAVLYSRENRKAAVLANWLIEGSGRSLIAAYRIGGRKAFEVWPSGCPGTLPDSPVCLGSSGSR